MPIPSVITDLSTVAGSNSPGGGETPGEGDNHLRAAYSFIAQLRDKLNGADLTTATLGAVLVSSLVASGAISCTDLTTTGNTILGNAATDTLNVGAGGIIKDASGNVGIGATPAAGFKLDFGTGAGGAIGGVTNIAGNSDSGAYTIWGGRSSVNGGYIQLNGSTYGPSSGTLFFGTASTTRLVLTTDGRFYGTALHNNAGAVTGTATQYIASGTYTPTLTNISNATGLSATIGQWKRVGNVVSVSGKIDCGATAGATLTVVRISLPIASLLTASSQCRGTGAHIAATSILAASVDGDATNDAAFIRFIPPATGSVETSFIFQYEVL